MKTTYIPPLILSVQIAVEQGFAASIQTSIEPLAWDEETALGGEN